MTFSDAAGLLVVVTALFAYLNTRLVHLPDTIGVMLIALVASLLVLGLASLGLPLDRTAKEMLVAVDFNRTVMNGMLGFILFAGALDVDLADLASEKWPVAFLALAGVVVSTFLVGFGIHYTLGVLGHPVPLSWCLVFGALISPTDPIAVLAIIRRAGGSKSVEMKVAGESLFNDGVAIVVFVVMLQIASGEGPLSAPAISIYFLREAVGGVAFGIVLGFAAFFLLLGIDDYNVEILITVATVIGGYAAAESLGTSAPIASVVAGLVVGNFGRSHAMSRRTREHLDTFWGLVDAMLNGVLFVLVGLEVLVLPLDVQHLVAAAIAIPVVLSARLLSVAVPGLLPFIGRSFDARSVAILTWGGLRGGISIALALSLPPSPYRNTLVMMTYGCALFAIAVQGLSVGPLMRALGLSGPGSGAQSTLSRHTR